MSLVPGVSDGIIVGGLAASVVGMAAVQVVALVVRTQRSRRFKRMLQAQRKSDGHDRLGLEELLADLVRLNREAISGLQQRVEQLEARLNDLEPASRLQRARPSADRLPARQEEIQSAPETYGSPPGLDSEPPRSPPKRRAAMTETDRRSFASLEQAYRDAVSRMTLVAFEDFVDSAQAEPFDLVNGVLKRASESTAPLIGVTVSPSTIAILPSWVILESFATIYRFERSMPEAVRLAFDLATSGSGRLALLAAAKASATGGGLQIAERGQLDGLSL